MEKKILFPQLGGLVHGGDYNPDQWLDRPDILEADVRMMKKAGMNSVTLGVFSWAAYEPSEGEFHFEWLEKIIEKLYQNGIYTVLSTPSGARPAWLDEKYPEAMRVDKRGVRNHHGFRHNHCMTSPQYREKVRIIDRKLAERFGSHPGVIMYHISNEFGGECYCPLCAKRFQAYLAEKFDHDIEKLNKAWWTSFWSHHYNSFEQIEPPYANGEGSVMGLNLEWKRFTTWSMNDFMKFEIDTLKSVTPDMPVTANFMRLFEGLDYRKMAPELDAVSWDNYPAFHNDWESFADTMRETAFQHAVMRSLKRGRPFMMMESAPGLVNWHPVNKLKRPGVHRLACLQAVACGSDTVQYFQWRKGRGSFEQFHGAVVDHLGTDDTRVFREVAEVGQSLQKLAPVAGTLVKTKAALLFDWDNRWAIQDVKALAADTKKYEETCQKIWEEFLKLGVDMDVVGSDEDLSPYTVVVAPMLYLLQPKTAENLKRFVKRGGQLLATYFTGYVDENQLCYLGGFPGDGLSDLFGVVSEEIDTFYPSDRNSVRFEGGSAWLCADGGVLEADTSAEGSGQESRGWEVRDYAEVLRVRDAEVLGTYGSDFYAGTAALTCKTYPVYVTCADSAEQTAAGKCADSAGHADTEAGAEAACGRAYYMAARCRAAQMRPLFEKMLADGGIPVTKLPENVEYHVRSGEEGTYAFYFNCGEAPVTLEGVQGTDLETGEKVDGSLRLGGYGAAVLKRSAC